MPQNKPLAERFREYVSRRALDLAETLPKFQAGRIHHLQMIRKREHKRAEQLKEKSKQPENATIKLQSITLVFCYEYEQFTSVHKSLKKAFLDSKELTKRIDDIRKRENALEDDSWYNLGAIVEKSNSHFIFDAMKRSKLPENVKRVEISHHRLLPSLASLEFTVKVGESLQNKLREIAERYYLPTSISMSLWPSKLFSSFSMSFANGAEKAVAHCLREFVNEVADWLVKDLRLNKNYIHFSAAHPLYQLEFPSGEGGFNEYSQTHTAWLSKYGYRSTTFDAYSSDSVIFCPAKKQNEFPMIAPLFIKQQQEDHIELVIKELLAGMVCSSSLLTRLTVYKLSIESLRSKSLMNLNARWRIIRKSGKTIYDLKHQILRIKRMLAEFQNAKHCLHHHMGETINLKTPSAGQDSNYSSNVLAYFESELKSLASSATMVDQALSERLSIENIFVMYRLQRRVFWLTVVGVCIAAIGLIATWDKIAMYLQQILVNFI